MSTNGSLQMKGHDATTRESKQMLRIILDGGNTDNRQQKEKEASYHQRHANHARQENPLPVDFHGEYRLLHLCTTFRYVQTPRQMSVRILHTHHTVCENSIGKNS